MEELTWGILLAAYLFVGGMAGGAYIIGALADLTGRKTKEWKVLSKSGIYVSLFSIIVGLVLLILDLGRFEVAPLSPLNAYVNFPTSIMTVGTWIITAFTVVSLLTAILWFFRGNRYIRKLLEIVGLLLGISTAAYTGILLTFARGRPFWNTPFLPSTFVVSGMLTGLAMALFLIPIIAFIMPRFFEDFRGIIDNRSDLAQLLKGGQRYISVLILIEILLIAIELGTGHGALSLLSGILATAFLPYIILGLIIPLMVSYYTQKVEYIGKYSMLLPANLASFILILVGGFLLRYVILTAGQIIH
jgi:formate-dependent nitrite reductase membrane component NrfD